MFVGGEFADIGSTFDVEPVRLHGSGPPTGFAQPVANTEPSR